MFSVRTHCVVATALLGCFITRVAPAAVTAYHVESVNNSSSPALSGFITQDVAIDFGGQWTGSQLLIQLTQGNIYQDAFGGATEPNPALVAAFPSLAFDTFLGAGDRTATPSAITPSVAGAAVDLGGGPSQKFDASGIDIAWFAPGGTLLTNGTDFFTARVSLSSNANGTYKYLASAGGQISQFSGTINNGVLTPDSATVPEPVSVAVLGLGASLLGWRRRKA